MKLTKGKITKLYSKNKQTKKRIKRERHTRKTKTFRRRKPFDLSNRTLKHIPYGGAEQEESVLNTGSTAEQEESPVMPEQTNKQEESPVMPEQTNNQEESPVMPEQINNESNSVEPLQMNDDTDNFALAQAFKILAKYVADNISDQLKNNRIIPIVNAAQKQSFVE